MPMRQHVPLGDEFIQFLIADVALIIAFSLAESGGLIGILRDSSTSVPSFEILIPVMAIVITASFVLHELMHKIVAQHFGAIAGFRTSSMGLVITLATSMFGFLFAIPGATMIYVQSFTKRENGLVSLAGPLTNFVIFAVFISVGAYAQPPQYSFLYYIVTFGTFISLILAFFNMLPIMPLDGSKVLAWNKPVYAATMGAIFVIAYTFGIIPVYNLVFFLIIALVFSMFYRGFI